MSIDLFFKPKTIAVIGASNNKEKVSYSLMENLRNFKGEVIPVNIHEKEILGKECYKTVLDFKERIDLAIIAVPAKVVASVLEECGKKRIKNIIIISAGFSEIENKKAENNLIRIAKKYGMRLLGPNCFGVVNPYFGLDTTFAMTTPEKGDIAFISQSGALWSAVSDWSIGKFGFSAFASLGNMADVGFSDLIEYFNNDEKTKVIVLYIELLKDGKRFMEVCKKSKKPIIAIKAGSSKIGKEAVMSHTGSLAGQYEIYKAAFKQCGVRLAETLTQAFDMAKIKEKIKGNKIVIISNAGGPGVLAADYFEKKGLEVVDFPEKFVKSLKLPETWSHGNPIDLVGDAKADRYRKVFDKLSKENFYDVVIVVLTPQKMTEIEETAEEVVKFKSRAKKNVIACFMGGKEIEKGKKILEENGVPCFSEVERAVDVLA